MHIRSMLILLPFAFRADYSVTIIFLQVLSFMTGTYILYSIGVKNGYTLQTQDVSR